MTSCDDTPRSEHTPDRLGEGSDLELRQQLFMERLRRQVFESVAREELLDHTLRSLVMMLEREAPRLRACVAYQATPGHVHEVVTGALGDVLTPFGQLASQWLSDQPASQSPLCRQDAAMLGSVTTTWPEASAAWAVSLRGGGEAAPPGVVAVAVSGDPQLAAGEMALLELAADLAGFAVNRRRQADQAVRRLMHDALTDLPNTSLLLDRLSQAMEMTRRQDARLVVVMLDLDGLRTINESLGRQAGDDVLCTLANRLRENLRRSDTVARTGGDKFTVVATVTAGRRDAATLARKITGVLSAPLIIAGRDVSMAVNAGIAMFPGDGDNAVRLMQAAEVALHRAKREGRNSVHFFEAAEHDTALADLELEGHLRRAIDQAAELQASGLTTADGTGLTLHYQPQVNTQGVIVGVEALARWTHATLGRIPPDRFIAAAEQCGLIIQFGEWALREALNQARRWHQQFGTAAPRVAVNVSSIQFAAPRFVEMVERQLAESGADPTHIELELTETVLMRDAEETGRKVSRLRSMGISVAIDDFGTGYSSLAYLHRLTIDTLKVDRSFVSGLGAVDRRPPGGPSIAAPTSGAAVTRAIISMGRSLGMTVLAEGVETEAQRALLERMGCDVLQGYLFSPPVTVERINSMLTGGAVLPVAAAKAIPA